MNQELFIDGRQVDLSETDTPIKLNFFLLDLNFLEKRGGVVSNSFKVPATKNNNETFGRYNDLQTPNPQNFSKDRTFEYYVRGQLLASGTAVCKDFTFTNTPDFYSIVLKSDNLVWAEYLKNLKLVDLSLPTINYDEATVRSSWANTYSDKYTAPLVFYGSPKNNGLGVPNVFEFEDFRYWLFIYPMIKEMFQLAGFSVVSDFMDTPTAVFDFKKWTVLYNDKEIYGNVPASINFKTDIINEDRNCLDMLKGVAGMFTLMFDTDLERKVVTIEPFDVFFSDVFDAEGKIDLSKKQILKQYSEGKQSIVLTYKLDSFADSYSKIIVPLLFTGLFSGTYAQFLVKGTSPIYTGGFDIAPQGEIKVTENYFTGFMTGQFNILGSSTIWVPYVIDEELVSTSIPDKGPTNAPRIGYYAGMKTMKDVILTTGPSVATFKYHGDAARWDRPFLYLCDYAAEDTEQNYYYSDQWNSLGRQFLWYVYGLPPTPPLQNIILPGLASKYYRNLLCSIVNGRLLQSSFKINEIDVAANMKRKTLEYDKCQWNILEIRNYNPSSNNTTELLLLETKKADQPFMDTLIQGAYCGIEYLII